MLATFSENLNPAYCVSLTKTDNIPVATVIMVGFPRVNEELGHQTGFNMVNLLEPPA